MISILGKVKSISERNSTASGFFWRDVLVEGKVDGQTIDGLYKVSFKKDISDEFAAKANVGDDISVSVYLNGRAWKETAIVDLSAAKFEVLSMAPTSESTGNQLDTLVTKDDDLPF